MGNDLRTHLMAGATGTWCLTGRTDNSMHNTFDIVRALNTVVDGLHCKKSQVVWQISQYEDR